MRTLKPFYQIFLLLCARVGNKAFAKYLDHLDLANGLLKVWFYLNTGDKT